MIAVIDYDVGNLKNVATALKTIELDSIITRDADKIANAEAVILPGVGAFSDAVKNLKMYNLIDTLDKVVASGKILMGICLGMQMLFTKSFEDGEWNGLNYLEGEVVPFERSDLKVPHMGWNNLTIQKPDGLLRGISEEDYVYFVHSYYVSPRHFKEDVLAYTEYGVKVPAVVRRDNVIGMQFHPEKSASVGMRLLQNFKELLK